MNGFYGYFTASKPIGNTLHKVMFDDAVNDECGTIKCLIDVAWIMQPDQGYAESMAKAVGYIFDPLRASMDLEKLRKRTLCQGWMPPVRQRDALLNDMVKELLIQCVRGIKSDYRSQMGCIPYQTYRNHSKQNAMPCWQY